MTTAAALLVAALVFLLVRNAWVWRVRGAAQERGYEWLIAEQEAGRHDSIAAYGMRVMTPFASYEAMVWQVWIWDVRRFVVDRDAWEVVNG